MSIVSLVRCFRCDTWNMWYPQMSLWSWTELRSEWWWRVAAVYECDSLYDIVFRSVTSNDTWSITEDCDQNEIIAALRWTWKTQHSYDFTGWYSVCCVLCGETVGRKLLQPLTSWNDNVLQLENCMIIKAVISSERGHISSQLTTDYNTGLPLWQFLRSPHSKVSPTS